jgi:pilus assembly protein CpaB
MRLRRRHRAGLLAVAAVACGGLAASEVRSTTERIEASVGPTLPVVVARRALDPGTRLGGKTAERVLEVRQVPRAFVPADSIAVPVDVVGARTSVPVPQGAFLTAAHLESGHGAADGGELLPGERAIEVPVVGAAAVGDLRPGARVDVLVTSDSRSGASGRTEVALESVELLALTGGGHGDVDAGPAADARATLRVTARQAVMLTAAANFAREIRLLARPRGDSRRIGAVAAEGAR